MAGMTPSALKMIKKRGLREVGSAMAAVRSWLSLLAGLSFLSLLREDNPAIEFGAAQVVLVRDAAAKERLPPVLKDHALVMTVAESKGLEFDDVFLYNFWSDSPAQQEWRVMYNAVEDDGTISYATGNVVRRPLAFNPMEHSILLSELKHLYTAITRARCRIIVFDEDQQRRAPMFE